MNGVIQQSTNILRNSCRATYFRVYTSNRKKQKQRKHDYAYRALVVFLGYTQVVMADDILFVSLPSQILFIPQSHYHYALSVIYFTAYFIIYVLVSIYFQWKIKRMIHKTDLMLQTAQSQCHRTTAPAATHDDDGKTIVDVYGGDTEETESLKGNPSAHGIDGNGSTAIETNPNTDVSPSLEPMPESPTPAQLAWASPSSPSSSRNVFFNEMKLKTQSTMKAWCFSLHYKRRIYFFLILQLIEQSLQFGVISRLYFILCTNPQSGYVHITLFISLGICLLYKLIACITVYNLSRRCVDIALELLNFTLLRSLYVSYRLYAKYTSAPQKFMHLLHASCKSSALLLLFIDLLVYSTQNTHSIDDDLYAFVFSPYFYSYLVVSFMCILLFIINNDTNIMKPQWKYSQLTCTDCRLSGKYICRSLFWRFAEVTHRMLLFILLYIVFSPYVLLTVIIIDFCFCFVLFYFNRSVLVLGSIFFYHVTAGKYFGGGTHTKNVGYYIFVSFSIYRFIFSFLSLIVLTFWNFIDIQSMSSKEHARDFTQNPILSMLLYEWFTLFLWILSMFYVTEKGSRAVYNDQFLAPLAIYQQFNELLDFIVFGASIKNLVQQRYDHDGKNIIQYLCASSNKVTRQSQSRLDIIRNILFKDSEIYKQLMFETNEQNQTCLHYAVSANQLILIKWFIEDSVAFDSECKMDINSVDNNDQTCLHVAIERSYIDMVKYFVQCTDLNIAVKDCMNRTYLHHAVMSQSLQIVKCFDLVNEDRIDFHAIDDYGKTCLFYAENEGLIDFLILKHEMDINAIDLDGKTMLFHVVNENKLALIKHLIEQCQADINIADNNGNLAFFYCQSIEVIDYLIQQCHIDCTAVNNHGQCAIFNAVAKHYDDNLCKYYIENCNVDISRRDNYNRSLIDVAVEYLNVPQVQYLSNKLESIAESEHHVYNEEANQQQTESKQIEPDTTTETKEEHPPQIDDKPQLQPQTEEEDVDVIDIKTWICPKDKLIESLWELFKLGGYGVDNLLRGVNEDDGHIHNIHYICHSMQYIKRNKQLFEFGIEIISEMILKNNRLIDAQDDDGQTTIFYCIDAEVYELVTLFVENGTDLYHTNIFRESPLEYAIQKCKSPHIRHYLTETKYNSPFPYTPYATSHAAMQNDGLFLAVTPGAGDGMTLTPQALTPGGPGVWTPNNYSTQITPAPFGTKDDEAEEQEIAGIDIVNDAQRPDPEDADIPDNLLQETAVYLSDEEEEEASWHSNDGDTKFEMKLNVSPDDNKEADDVPTAPPTISKRTSNALSVELVRRFSSRVHSRQHSTGSNMVFSDSEGSEKVLKHIEKLRDELKTKGVDSVRKINRHLSADPEEHGSNCSPTPQLPDQKSLNSIVDAQRVVDELLSAAADMTSLSEAEDGDEIVQKEITQQFSDSDGDDKHGDVDMSAEHDEMDEIKENIKDVEEEMEVDMNNETEDKQEMSLHHKHITPSDEFRNEEDHQSDNMNEERSFIS